MLVGRVIKQVANSYIELFNTSQIKVTTKKLVLNNIILIISCFFLYLQTFKLWIFLKYP